MKSSILLLSITFFSINITYCQDLEFKIKSLEIKNNKTFIFILKNNSNIDFCLPLITKSDDIKLLNNFSDYFSFFPNFYVTNEKGLTIKSYELELCDPLLSISIYDYQKKINEMKRKFLQNINFSNIIKIKRKAEIELKFVFNEKIELNDSYCSTKFYNVKPGMYSISMVYSSTEIYKELSKELLRKIKEEKFELFEGKIVSNKIPLIIE